MLRHFLPAIYLRRQELEHDSLLPKMPPSRGKPRRRMIARLVGRPLQPARDSHPVKMLPDFDAKIFRRIRRAAKERLGNLLADGLRQPSERDADFPGKSWCVEARSIFPGSPWQRS